MTDFSDAGPDTWLEHFGGAYGRMCVLAAQAQKQGISLERVRIAFAGETSSDMQALLFAIRRQRRHVITLMKQRECCAVSQAVVIQSMKEIREAIGQEWQAPMPDLGQPT